ncbi:MAG: trypsin-like peptidase domain-containing protein [Methylotenera sp.]|nr:trypsin-like peptidase domain-containing protein [Oligoflexia bacterium]
MNAFSKFLIPALLLTLAAQSAFAFPMPKKGQRPAEFAANRHNFLAGAVDFTAIVALSDCSGSVVRFTTSLGSDQAMVLTNGHCLDAGMPGPGKVITNSPVSRRFKLLTSDGQGSLGTLNADQVIFSSMTKTDITLYRLKETYDQIEKNFKVTALTLSPQHPQAGAPIAIPSGYWRRMYNCSIDKFIYQLKEDKWTMVDSIRYQQPGCATIGGTSGSPIVNANTHEVIGINNTGNEDGAQCTMNNPCEVDEQGKITVVKKASYGQQTFWLYGCLTSKNTLDLNKAGCLLPKPQN